ncbi:MAG TPA: Hsp20/alpha crystallin family protein [Thermoanaerobaculia bacterium]|jgi:HSP20 family protein|nr:Hsp20/alpha crystallin family protein [Thermoanaerobaculia bacterium]
MRTAMTRWNPTGSYVSRDPFARLLEGFLGENLNPSEDVSNRAWTPAVNIRETDNAFFVEAELPGMTKDDIEITLENNMLKLSGERRFEKDTKEENYHRVERSYGTFLRTFSLPSQVDSEGVKAAFKEGVLTIEIPKAEEAKPRKIAIN